jgi:hypothetical protein
VILVALFGNFLVKDIAAIFGSKRSLFVAIGIYVLGSLFFLFSEGFWGVCLGAAFFGLYDQLVAILLKILMNDLFGQEYTYYLPICYAGFAFSPFVLPVFISMIANPMNEVPSVRYIEGSEEVSYFSADVVRSYDRFIWMQLIANVAVLSTLLYFLEIKSKIPSRLSLLLHHASKGNISEARVTFRENRIKAELTVDKTIRDSMRRLPKAMSITSLFSRNLSKHGPDDRLNRPAMKEMLIAGNEWLPDVELKKKRTMSSDVHLRENVELLPADFPLARDSKYIHPSSEKLVATEGFVIKNEGGSRPDAVLRLEKISSYENDQKVKFSNIKSDLFSIAFILLTLVTTIRSTTTKFFLNDFKIIGLFYFKDDALINLVGSIANIGDIVVCLIFGFILSFLKIRGCYVFMLGTMTALHLLYGLFPGSLLTYFCLSTMHRVR